MAVTRRRALGWLGASTGTLWLGLPAAAAAAPPASTPRCVVRPEQTEGPYFVDERLVRTDITSDPKTGVRAAGVPLTLALRVYTRAGRQCVALPDARVDVWHCDRLGRYSGVREYGLDTSGQAFLRGQQVTDDAGEVRFETVYPGAYPGRAVHVHVKVREASGDRRAREFTSQLYFEDAVNDAVLSLPAYTASHRARLLRNDEDGIYQDGGAALTVALERTDGGFAGTFELALEA
jgi:protocatechuate 3,4-dioxygenase beta subunit